MNLDRAIIEGRFDIIDRNVRFLEGIQDLSQKEFLSSYRDVQASKHSLLEIVESCIDVANYIISTKGFSRAESYREMFVILAREDILDEALADKLQEMAKFRNLLVHRYAEIDNTRVLDIIKNNLTDVREFQKQILEVVQGELDSK